MLECLCCEQEDLEKYNDHQPYLYINNNRVYFFKSKECMIDKAKYIRKVLWNLYDSHSIRHVEIMKLLINNFDRVDKYENVKITRKLRKIIISHMNITSIEENKKIIIKRNNLLKKLIKIKAGTWEYIDLLTIMELDFNECW